jgi:DNA polymerase III delta prime subunit
VIAQLELVLAGAKNVLRQAAASQAQESDTSLSLVKNRALVKIVKEMPSLESRLSEIADAAKTQTKKTADDEASYAKGLAQLKKDLSSLIS